MKVGIITLPLHLNYGGYLQNYALQIVLKKLGHIPLTLNQRPKRKPFKERISTVYLPNIKTIAMIVLGNSKGRSLKHLHGNDLKLVLWKNSFYFLDKYIEHTQPLRPRKDFKNICDKYNLSALIAGSDQVWRPRYIECLDVNYLAFDNRRKIKKISFAASFGTDKWEYGEQETLSCKKYLESFSLITVREKSAVDLCKKYFEQNSYQVLDPTLLLTKEDYQKIIEEENEPPSLGSLFCYVLDETPRKRTLIETIENTTGLRSFSVNIGKNPINYSKNYILNHLEIFQNPPVTKWLRGFMDAKMVITDSFHAVAFSVIFNKPFWVVGNKSRGLARFYSILELFHLEKRLIDETDIEKKYEWNSPIDWVEVNNIRKERIKTSIELLRKGLS